MRTFVAAVYLWCFVFWTGVVLIGCVGCREPDTVHHGYDGPDYEECTCLKLPEPYIVNMGYSTNVGPKSFPVELSYTIKDHIRFHDTKDEIYKFQDAPTGLYKITGISADNSRSYYYSQSMPERQENGLLLIRQVDGPHVFVEYKDIEVKIIPCSPLPLDEMSLERIAKGKAWAEYRINRCPYHSYEDNWR